MHTRFNIAPGTRSARISIFFFFCAACALIAPRAWSQDATADGPRLLLQEREIDFGEVRRGEVIEAVFVLANVGNEPLKVVKVQPG